MSGDSLAPGTILDVEGTLTRFGGDKELLAEMMTMLLEDAPGLLAKVHHAVEARDSSMVRMSAHALRGLVAGCGGVRAAQAAHLLEDAGQHENLGNALALSETLSAEVDVLLQAIRAYQD